MRLLKRSVILRCAFHTVLSATVFLSGCPSPFDASTLSLLEDRNAPEVVFTAPAASAAFKSSLTVTGSVVDYDGDGQPRAGAFSSYISSVAYYLDGAENEALELDVSSSGGFSFTLATADYDSQITIVVTATDRNGNVGSASLTLAPDAEARSSPSPRRRSGTSTARWLRSPGTWRNPRTTPPLPR